ncbi:hypothetical protein JOF56_010176 [Kibdelosporangium banguiense]|uniref:IrrE N-terminal-like domain-containing protein n=1 Tax=Kibdelosporangium banguiense TaxID=1365924 RepID=A0ABS4TZF4_9PSEU|nr:hypothetical protein [Kibdelosporangium banguiense]MBP2329791.1 hypothetical protein [Kibdelosporangium banguiense]
MSAELRRLRRRCEAIAAELPLVKPFDVRELCRLVALRQGRPIHLMPINGMSEAHGLWLATDSADLFFYEAGTALPHQEHIILHELSHLLCGHYREDTTAADHLRELIPHLDPKVIRMMLRRTSYVAAEEQEAELLASIIRQRAGLVRSDSINGRIRAAFDWPRDTHG